MTISLYAASVPVFKQMLNALSDVLGKAQAHAEAKNIDANVFLQARLYPDMFPLVRQVQIAVDFAKGFRPAWPRSNCPSTTTLKPHLPICRR